MAYVISLQILMPSSHYIWGANEPFEFLQDPCRNRTACSAIFALEGFNMGKASYSAIFALQEKDGDMYDTT